MCPEAAPEQEKTARISLAEFPVNGSDQEKLDFVRGYLNQSLLCYMQEGDPRLEIVDTLGRNMHGISMFLPDNRSIVIFSSCTGSPLSQQQVKDAEILIKEIASFASKASTYREFYTEFQALNWQGQIELVRLLGLNPKETLCKEDSSGHDTAHTANLIALEKAAAKTRKTGQEVKVVSIYAKNQTGMRSNRVYAGLHPFSESLFGTTYEGPEDQEVRIEGYPEMLLRPVDITDARGEIRDTQEVDQEILDNVQQVIDDGNVPIARLVVDTKIGVKFGIHDLTLIKTLRKRFGDNVVIEVDDAQRRISTEFLDTLIHKYDCVVTTTTSKALGGAMAHALSLINKKNAAILNDPDSPFPPGLNAHTCKNHCGPGLEGLTKKIENDTPDFPGALKRETGLTVLRALSKIEIIKQNLIAHELIAKMREVFNRSKFIKIVERPQTTVPEIEPAQRQGIYQGTENYIGIMHENSIFLLEIGFPNGQRPNAQEVKILRWLLNNDLGTLVPEQQRTVGETGYTTGPKILLSEKRVGPRVAVGWRDIVAIYESGEWQTTIGQQYLEQTAGLVWKIGFIVENWEKALEFYNQEEPKMRLTHTPE